MVVTKHHINITEDTCGLLRMSSPCGRIGRVDDNNSIQLVFSWPSAYDGLTAVATFAHAGEWMEMEIADKSLMLTAQITQYDYFELGVRFEGADFRKSAGYKKFDLKPILKGSAPMPEPWPALVPEAPVDGKLYGRQNASWMEVVGGGASTFAWYPSVTETETESILSFSRIDTTIPPEPVNIRGGEGADGKSAFAYAADGGYTGTEVQFYNDLAAMDGLASALAGI